MSLLNFSHEIQSYSSKLQSIISAGQEILHTSSDSNVLALRSYLASRLSLDSQKFFELGYLPSPDNFQNFEKYFNLSDFLTTRIFYQNAGTHSIFPHHNLILPYRDEYGNYVSFSARTLLPELERKEKQIEKYKNLFFQKNQYVFGLYYAKKNIINEGHAFVVEGQFDTYSCHSRNLSNTIGICGSSFSYHQQFLLRLYTSKLYFILDNDKAGRKAAKKIKQQNFFQFQIYFLYLPSGYKDVDEYFRSHSKKDFYSKVFITADEGEKCEILPPTDQMLTNICSPK